MTRSKVLISVALLGYLLLGSSVLLSAVPQLAAPSVATSVRHITESQKSILGIHPGALILGCMLIGSIALLTWITGRETLKSIDFERTYREYQKPQPLPFQKLI